MSGLFTAFITGIAAFSATNIDDIVILLLLFSQVNATFRRWHIVIGQYLGFTVLVIASLPGFFGSLILSQSWIGLLGLVPIALGLNGLLNQEQDSLQEATVNVEQFEQASLASFLSPQTYSVAAITIANGSDNIGVYMPLFANSNYGSLLIILSVFFPLIGVWCYIAYKLTNLPAIADIITQYGNYIVPVVLIGIGVFIVLGSGALSFIKLAASCLCLTILVKNSENSS